MEPLDEGQSKSITKNITRKREQKDKEYLEHPQPGCRPWLGTVG